MSSYAFSSGGLRRRLPERGARTVFQGGALQAASADNKKLLLVTGTRLNHWRLPVVPIGFQLETVADLKQCQLIEVAPDELQADRQSSFSEPTRNTQGRGSGEVCRISVPPDRTQDGNGLAGDLHVRLVNARCRDRYCRRRKNINLLERCAELLGNNPSDPLCQPFALGKPFALGTGQISKRSGVLLTVF